VSDFVPNIDSLIAKIGSDTTWMFVGAIALVVLLFVVLVVVVSSMRVKSYKTHFINAQIDNQEKAKKITQLQRDLQSLKAQHEKALQQLKQFEQTKEILAQSKEAYEKLLHEHGDLEKQYRQIEAKLGQLTQTHDTVQESRRQLEERCDALAEENNKLRVNNARLLRKLEMENLHGN